MGRLSVRSKLILLIVIAILSIGFTSFSGWASLQRVVSALHTISDQNLSAVRLVGIIRTGRLEAIIAVQEGAGWKIDKFESLFGSEEVVLEEGQFLFGSILERFEQSRAKASEAYQEYDQLPKTEAQEELWQTIKPLWSDFARNDQRQADLIRNLAQAEDWGAFRRFFREYESYASIWSNSYSTLDRPLSELAAVSVQDAEASQKVAEQSVESATQLTFSAVGIASVMLCLIGLTITRSILRPLNTIRSVLGEIATENDFTLRAPVSGKDELAMTSISLNSLLEHTQSSLRVVRDSAIAIDESSFQSADIASRVASSSRQQSETAHSMAAAIEQMLANIALTHEGASDALERSRLANNAATSGASVIGKSAVEMRRIADEIEKTGHTVTALEDESGNISTIVQVIQAIADQTNLLALNAAIEAARAGDQGRGFAVVADEVRSLAQRTSSSAQEIADKVTAMQQSTSAAVENMQSVMRDAESARELSEEAARHIEEIQASITSAVSSIEQVSNSVTEQNLATSQISERVNAVSKTSEENCSAGDQSASVARDLDSAANDLRNAIDAFKL
ncbi:methyl-accepting chemotaxis protein [Marinobacter sp. NP-6]|uniref:methyl-accepting chemotaxis protein n=1 Tax=Marinobacter sp. NP-6 TaxID=2488666 RepID=UPI001C8D5966|nr:methyl-accepting chemotaxis protein [Marinobacter sp. NP-6]